MNNNPYPNLTYIPYDRGRAVEYARRWALERNPIFEDYTGIGGDCTNFVSQSVYAGSGVMNYTPTYGWYYINADERSPSWTGVEYFYNFMTTNEGAGPFAEDTSIDNIEIGDVIQLGDSDGRFYHSLVVVRIFPYRTFDSVFVSAHDEDSNFRRLSSYEFSSIRYIHFLGVRR